MRGSTLAGTLVMAIRTADWLRSRQEKDMPACSVCGEVRTTERVYQSGTVTFTMKHFICKHTREEKKPMAGESWP